MDDFTIFRLQLGYSEKSIQTQNHYIKHFKDWCITQNINFEKITYSQVLQFIDHERERGILNQSIINAVNAIRVYFDYLQESGTVRQNIIKRVKIRNRGKKTFPDTLVPQQLEDLYRNFVNMPEWEHRSKNEKELHKRNIVLLGLLVYQGLTSGEIAKLETNHINLMEGKIYIPSSRKSNARTLKLQSNQILPFKTYIEEFTPKPYLFPSQKHTDLVSNIIQQAKKLEPKIINSRQIRSSVIMNWLKSNNIRQVQYMAGHRSIVSTEEYRNQDLTDLSKQLELFHPLK